MEKETLNKVNLIYEIENLMKKYPNDMDFGRYVRKLIIEINELEQTKKG